MSQLPQMMASLNQVIATPTNQLLARTQINEHSSLLKSMCAHIDQRVRLAQA